MLRWEISRNVRVTLNTCAKDERDSPEKSVLEYVIQRYAHVNERRRKLKTED